MNLHVTFKVSMTSLEMGELVKSRGFNSLGEYVASLVEEDAKSHKVKSPFDNEITITLGKQ